MQWEYESPDASFSTPPVIGSDGTIYVGSYYYYYGFRGYLYAIGEAGETEQSVRIGNEGRILYVRNVQRTSTDGEITQTGDLYIKELLTGIETQVTNFGTGAFSILNPQFNSDGTKILFTSDEKSSGKFSVYLVIGNTTNNSGVGILLDGSGAIGDGYKYASLSPDGNLVAYTRYVDANETDLDIYNIETGYSEVEVVSLANIPDPDGRGVNSCIVRHPVFIDDNIVAFVAEVDGIQNIYTVNLTTYEIINLTGNTTNTAQYGRIRSGWRGSVNSLIYAKRTKIGLSWGNWDIYIMDVGTTTEYQVTNTSRDEYDGAFYGDGTTDVSLTLTDGNMFYASQIIGSAVNIWQTNYNTSGISNGMKVQRTAETGNVGLVDWGPAVVSVSPSYSITDTQLVYTATDGTNTQVFTASFLDDITLEAGTLRTTGTNDKYNPELGRRQIVYTISNSNNPIYIMNADGTNITEFESAESGVNKLYPSLSPDGKWVVWSESGVIHIKLSSQGSGDSSTNLNVGTQAEDPKISPDSNLLIWVENTGGVRQIKSVKVSLDPTTGDASVSGTPTILGGNTGNFNDRCPSFSPDGKTIVFVSDRDGTNKIYTMGSNGTNVQVLPITATDPAYPVFSPIGDGKICFVAGAPGTRTIHIYDGTTATNLGVIVDGDEISWNLIYTPGEIFGERSMPERVAKNKELTYRVKIDVDEKNKPNSFVLKEIVPGGWTVSDITINGNSVDYSEKSNTPVSGLKTVELTFMDGLTGTGIAGEVKDHIVEFTFDVGATEGTQSVTGKLIYNLPGEDNHETGITGNSRVLIANPYLPFDKYSYQGATRYEKPDGVVDTEDLLYAIDCWTDNIQIEGGYGAIWPSDITGTRYDDIILATIDIWASDKETQGWYGPSGGTGTTQVTDKSTKSGEYKYVGPDCYAPAQNVSVVGEMYWTQGKWADN